MSRKRKNAGEGYGYMFHGAFSKKADAKKKERSRKGAWVKSAMTKHGMRYIVMSPRTNPIKRKKKAEKNPHELLIMGANPTPHESREITVPPGTTITIRTNPEPRPNWMGSAKAMVDAEFNRRQDQAYERQQRARRKATRASEAESDRYFSDLRKRSQASSPKEGRTRRKLSGLFHELYGRNNPICGHMVSGEPCTRKPGHRGPHLPQGPRFAHGHGCEKGWAPKATNPSAATLREEFTGKPSEFFIVEHEPHMVRGDYAQLGELLALYVKPGRGEQVQQITFSKNRPLVVSDESARQIWFVGGDQDISSSLDAFGARDRGAGLFELGEARRIDYKQRKEHVPDPEVDEWRHDFGEESGVKPVLLFDRNKKRLLLEGGEYQIRAEGIIN